MPLFLCLHYNMMFLFLTCITLQIFISDSYLFSPKINVISNKIAIKSQTSTLPFLSM